MNVCTKAVAIFAVILFACVPRALAQDNDLGSAGCGVSEGCSAEMSDYVGCDQCGCVFENSCDCCNPQCLAARSRLFGDWFGIKPCLAQRGVVTDIQLTQFYQGVTGGGSERKSAYGGKVDTMITFLGEPLGLNKGLTTILHAETRFGEDVNLASGALALSNTNMLYPLPGEHDTAITGLLVMQALSERFALAAGKINALDLWTMLYPKSGRGIDGFMNMSLVAFPTFLRTTNLSILGAGVLQMEGPQIKSGVIVYDTHNSSTTSGFDQLFTEGAVILGLWRHFTQYGGLPGSHAFIGNWSSREYTSVDPSAITIIPGQGLNLGQVKGSWGLAYVLDQTLWVDCCNENRNVRIFSVWSLADGNPSLYRWSGNLSLESKGLFCGRDQDRAGVGYFYEGLSSNFKQLVSPVADVEDVQGVEIYYNAAITPWFHLTADLQIIDNENAEDDTAIILGLRANIAL